MTSISGSTVEVKFTANCGRKHKSGLLRALDWGTFVLQKVRAANKGIMVNNLLLVANACPEKLEVTRWNPHAIKAA